MGLSVLVSPLVLATSQPPGLCFADGEKPGSRDVIPMEALGPGECRYGAAYFLWGGQRGQRGVEALKWARWFCLVCLVLGKPTKEVLVGKEI